MIVITGGSGFIGSNLLSFLNDNKNKEILIVEELDTYQSKFDNLKDLEYLDCINKDTFIRDLNNNSSKYHNKISKIFHLGACSKTTESDRDYIMHTNLEYSKDLLKYSSNNNISLIYASSASVYGEATVFSEAPSNESYLNHYAESKLMFDNYYRQNMSKINSQVVGLRYFNVFGPRELHKEGMSSVVFHFYNQLHDSGTIKLFKGSHGYNDGEQRRDFTHVDDIVDGLIRISKTDKVHEDAWELGSGRNYSVNELFLFFKEKFDCESISIPDQKGNYRETLNTNPDAERYLDWQPQDRLKNYILSL